METIWLLCSLVAEGMTPPQLCRLAKSHALASLALDALAPKPNPGFRWVVPSSTQQDDDIDGLELSMLNPVFAENDTDPNLPLVSLAPWIGIARSEWSRTVGGVLDSAFFAVGRYGGGGRLDRPGPIMVFSHRSEAETFAAEDAPNFFVPLFF
jgi:hypothetical protein